MDAIQYIQNTFEVNDDIQHIIEFIINLTKFGIIVKPPRKKFHGVRFISLFSMPHIPQYDNIEDEPREYWDEKEYDTMRNHSDFIEYHFNQFDIGHMYDDSLDVVMESPDDDDE